jgi:hypothetical protein
MRHWCLTIVLAGALQLGSAAVAQPTSEGHPHKWQVVDKSMADLVANGFELKTVVYDSSQTQPSTEPDVHYFLQKGTTLARCDFLRRGQASIYWCYQLTKPGRP